MPVKEVGSAPSHDKVWWRAARKFSRMDGANHIYVKAQTWFYARQQAAVELQAAPEELDVTESEPPPEETPPAPPPRKPKAALKAALKAPKKRK